MDAPLLLPMIGKPAAGSHFVQLVSPFGVEGRCITGPVDGVHLARLLVRKQPDSLSRRIPSPLLKEARISERANGVPIRLALEFGELLCCRSPHAGSPATAPDP